jgi:hypothetical protein
MLVGWILVLGSIVMFVGGIAMSDSNPAYAWLIVAAFIVFLGGAIYGLVSSRMVAATHITDTHVWLKGVCPEFLSGLPEWPYTP